MLTRATTGARAEQMAWRELEQEAKTAAGSSQEPQSLVLYLSFPLESLLCTGGPYAILRYAILGMQYKRFLVIKGPKSHHSGCFFFDKNVSSSEYPRKSFFFKILAE